MNKPTLFSLILLVLFVQIKLSNAQCHLSDWTALKALYQSTNSNNWINQTGWNGQIANQSNPPANCNLLALHGIDLNEEGRVTTINLSNNGLNGSIPAQLENLTFLQILNLNDNDLSGQIPTEISNLTNLRSLFLNNNLLNGTIPASLGNLSNLKYVQLSNNNLSGSIPVQLSTLSNLIGLHLIGNNLTGLLPPALANLSNLEVLRLSNNGLTGTIPTEFGNLNNLTDLHLSANNLSGTIPTELSNLSNLNKLVLNNNDLTDFIPKELAKLNNLNVLKVAFNQLSGCFEPELYKLCLQLTEVSMDNGNSFVDSWANFCSSCEGACISGSSNANLVPTNYSGCVELTLDNNQNVLKNDAAIVFDYNTCSDYNNISTCDPVVDFDNLAANEALWVATKAAAYFSTYHNVAIPQINIVVNDMDNPNGAKYKPSQNIIFIGKGDGVKRNSMSAPDIVGHEYAHAVVNAINYLGNYKISGAFNESYADILGELIEHYCYGYNNDWIYGNEVMVSAIGNAVGLRNLSNPKDETMRYQLPNTYKGEHWIHIDNVCFHIDNCGIHTNSGVHSYWFYLLANGGSGLNDNGNEFEVTGIGVEKAAAIAFDNLMNHLNPQSTFMDAREGSIEAAQTLYNNQPNVLASTIEAWNAVGIIELIENPIEFKIANAFQAGGETTENNQTVIPVQFDLIIDSLGMDISADELCFTLHLPDTYMELYIETTYAPLTETEIMMNKIGSEVNICINRLDNGTAKRNLVYPLISSNSPILRFKVCIVSEDVHGEENSIAPINISGFTNVDDEPIQFTSATLPFGFDFDGTNNNDPQNRLELSLKLNHKNCNTLGTLQVEILDNYLSSVAPYTYILKDTNGTILNEIINIDNPIQQFYNLEEGTYEIEVRDSNTDIVATESKDFIISFVGGQTGSECCAENLIIPPGVVNGIFNTSERIRFSNGTFVAEGSFKICE